MSQRLIRLAALILLQSALSLQAAESERLAPVLQSFVDSHALAGAVILVADKEKVLDVEAVGWMDIANNKPMRPDCLFWVASQSKPIVATAMMMLVDEGKIALDDPVAKYLPEYKDQWVIAEQDKEHQVLKKPQHPMLIRHLLSHTSGLPYKIAIEQPSLDLLPLEIRVHGYASVSLLFEPGTGYNYANAGMNTAARIVEIISGIPYEKYLDERIFKPLGMTDTTFFPSSSQVARLAKSYKTSVKGGALEECPIDRLKYPLDGPGRYPVPGNGLFSTANDLSIFYRMIANNGIFEGKRILNEKSVKEMKTDQTGEPGTKYGFGFATKDGIGHAGSYNTYSAYLPQLNLITVFLVQHADWKNGGKNCESAFRNAACKMFGRSAPTSQ